jgi:membrane protein DedA with SNARE-associated domain
MTLATLIQTYGYAAVFAGAFLEGETIVVMAGFAAERGYLSLPWVTGVAAVSGFLGDQLYFYLGRHYGPRVLRRFPRMKPRAARALALLKRHNLPFIFALRFMYGLRMVGPLAIGMSRVGRMRFLVADLVSALIWAALVAGAGYLFGQALELAFVRLRHYEEAVLIVIGVIGAIVWILHRVRQRHL